MLCLKRWVRRFEQGAGMDVVLTLREITPENQQEVRALKVQPQQVKFVADVDKSLADAFVWKDAQVRAAYLDDVIVDERFDPW